MHFLIYTYTRLYPYMCIRKTKKGLSETTLAIRVPNLNVKEIRRGYINVQAVLVKAVAKRCGGAEKAVRGGEGGGGWEMSQSGYAAMGFHIGSPYFFETRAGKVG